MKRKKKLQKINQLMKHQIRNDFIKAGGYDGRYRTRVKKGKKKYGEVFYGDDRD